MPEPVGVAPGETTIRASGVDLAYGPEPVVRDVSFACRAAEVTAVVGPNGSGKSTVLNAIAGLLVPVRGELEVLGGAAADARTRVAYALQATTVDERLPVTVREVVRMARYPRVGMFRPLAATDHEAVDRALARLEVDALAARRLDELSGGQRQRVFIAQGLAQEADVLLLDEPVTGLDLVSRSLILDAITAERSRGATVVVTTHNLGEAATADQMLLLAGRVVAVGPPGDVLTKDNLIAAYGERVVSVEAGLVFFDDGAHHHAH